MPRVFEGGHERLLSRSLALAQLLLVGALSFLEFDFGMRRLSTGIAGVVVVAVAVCLDLFSCCFFFGSGPRTDGPSTVIVSSLFIARSSGFSPLILPPLAPSVIVRFVRGNHSAMWPFMRRGALLPLSSHRYGVSTVFAHNIHTTFIWVTGRGPTVFNTPSFLASVVIPPLTSVCSTRAGAGCSVGHMVMSS